MHIKLFETEKDFYNGKSELETPSVSLINESDKVILSSDSQPSVSVDLGLPSGNIWATMNIGARSIEEAGMFFSWGNVDGHFDVDNINWDSNTYNNTPGQSINGSIPVNATYDAAQNHLGEDWKIPTKTEFQELINNCTSLQCTIKGRKGILFISNINGKSIFFPASGYLEDLLHNNFNNIGFYWSSTPFNKVSSYCLVSSNCSIQNLSNGYNIRPVQSVYDSEKTIIYEALTKLREVNNSSDPGIYVNGFNTTIEQHTFKNGIGIIEFQNSITSIGEYAFSGCSGLTSITIPNGVTSIGNSAFRECSGLTSITIPNSVTSIGSNAFDGCSGLTSITIPNSVTSIGSSAFQDCSRLTSVIISDNLTSIAYSAFAGCTSLTSVTIPNSVTRIGTWAFKNCSRLTYVTIGSGVTSIEDYAFYGCSRLTSITFGNSVTSIGSYAFWGCSSLTSVHISDIAAWCCIDFKDRFSNPLYYAHRIIFNGEEVKDLVIPNNVTSICDRAFENCSGLTSVNIPNSVTSIGERAFESCSSLTSINIGNSVTSIGESAFYGCRGLTSVTIPDSVTSIGNDAFNACRSLISITIPDSVTSIGISSFLDCTSLTSVTIPNNVTSINWGAFQDCSRLTSVTIPNSVTSIGQNAFLGCSGLTSVTIQATTPPTLNNANAFSNTNNCPIYVPSGSVDAYKAANNWSSLASRIQAIPQQ